MKGVIYLVENGELLEVEEEEYDSEELLQKNLAEYPRLLAGEQIDPDEPRKWLLVERESSIPDEEEGAGRWSADHLFLDQDGIPTVVEVKRSSDSRLRRTLVGQMLDYVSNASAYWGKGKIRSKFEAYHKSEGKDPEEAVRKSLDEEENDKFWQSVESNLNSGKIRMLFVSDDIPSELKRVVEFLNEQMDPAEVLALEVKQYAGEGQTALVPRIIGQTEEARGKKSTPSRKQWDEKSFLEDIDKKAKEGVISREEAEAIRDLHNFAKRESDGYKYGTGKLRASILPKWDAVHPSRRTFTLRTDGKINFWENLLIELDDTDWSDPELKVLSQNLKKIGGCETSLERMKERMFSINAEMLISEDDRKQFKEAIREFVRACERAGERS